MEYTFSMIKPDAVLNRYSGLINSHIEKNSLRIVAQKMIILSRRDAETFYQVHSQRPFFESLVNFIISGPVIVQVLYGENAVAKYRKIMGATNPSEADDNTIRKIYAESIEKNAIHGSDSKENADFEIAFFFSKREIFQFSITKN